MDPTAHQSELSRPLTYVEIQALLCQARIERSRYLASELQRAASAFWRWVRAFDSKCPTRVRGVEQSG